MSTYPNWFSMYAEGFFKRHLSDLAGRSGLRFLQIGAFTGDASLWLLDNVLTGVGSVLIDVDTWGGSDEPIHRAFDWHDVERLYDQRTVKAAFSGRVAKRKQTSASYLFGATFSSGFDFVYVDGDHMAASVLMDGVGAYQALKVGGLLAFDDYEWTSGKGATHDPGPAIDVMIGLFPGRLELIEVGAQAWLRKIA